MLTQALAAAIAADDHRLAPINAGQGVAMLRTVRPAAEVIDQLCAEAARLLDRRRYALACPRARTACAPYPNLFNGL